MSDSRKWSSQPYPGMESSGVRRYDDLEEEAVAMAVERFLRLVEKERECWLRLQVETFISWLGCVCVCVGGGGAGGGGG